MPQRPGFIVRIIAIIALIFTAGLGGTALKEIAGPWAQNILHLSIAALLIWAIVRPRSQTVDWKKQVSIGVALIAGLFTTIYFFGPTGSVGADGRTLASGWSILIAIVGLAAIWIGLSIMFGDPSSPGDILGSARFGNHADVDALAQSDGDLIIGRSGDGKLLRYDGPAHLLTIAPTRSGKGIGTIIPNLLTADRSIICIDPKGENAAITARARSTLGKVWCLDPFEVSGQPSARYNPLDRLDPASLDLAEDAMTLADALVHDPAGQSGDAHWNEEAKALIAGLILYAVVHEEPEHRTLATVRDYLTLAPKAFSDLLTLMQDSGGAGGLIARAANRQLGKSDREAAGVLSSAQRHTHFLDSPRIVASTSSSDFTFAGLKEEVSTVFLCLPPDRLDTYSRWLRLLIAQALTDMARSRTKPTKPVLFLLDEFAALGKLEPVERAMGLMAGYGLQLWPILQDIHQLRSLYGERAGTFLSNAGVLQAFGVNDYETADMLSRTMGKTTVRYETTGSSEKASWFDDPGRTISSGEHLTARNLMDPNEIMKLDPSFMLLMIMGKDPLIIRKIRYFEEREFSGLHDPV